MIEVLVSIFVLSVGLLGVATLIPLGQYTVSETVKADRAGSCARAAIREITNRRLLQPFSSPTNANPAYPNWVNSSGGYPPDLTVGMSYCIDPLLISRAAGQNVNLQSFPALNMIPNASRNKPLYDNTVMQRISYRGVVRTASTSAVDGVMPYTAAERIFVWQDDMVFDFPGDRQLRPRPIVTYADNFTSAYPTGGHGPALVRQVDGNYSWMVTLTPAPTEAASPSLGDRRTYNVSVVVFYKRKLDPPTTDEEKPNERVLTVLDGDYMLGRGMAGGGLTLTADRTQSGAAAAIRDSMAWLDVSPNEWLLLSAQYPAQGVPDSSGAVRDPATGMLRYFGERYFGWYKVTATEPAPRGNTTTAKRQVAISGPDWEFIPYSKNEKVTLQAVLVSNVLNVYTTTMELNLSPLWAK